jgi:threonine/homoserine/homoserine lactone efflux protein
VPSSATLAAFSAASLLLILLPGPPMIFLITRGVVGGRRVGAVSALGVESATLVYVIATALGLTAVLAASAFALSAVRYLGATYLLYLGVRTILKRRELLVPPDGTTAPPTSAWRSWRQGFLVGISNPKVALFFLAFFPQFVHPEAGPVVAQILVLGSIFVAIGIVFDVTYGLAGGAIRDLLARNTRAIRRSRVSAGLSYLVLGGWTAIGGEGKA